MGVLLWFVFGAIVGSVSEAMIREYNQKNDRQIVELGTGYSIFIAVVGALIAGWTLTLMGAPTMINVNPVSVGTPIFGAMIMLWVVRGLSPEVAAGISRPKFKR